MKQFCCGDVVPGCKATFLAVTEKDLFQQIAGHARADHGLVDIPEALLLQVRAHIHDVAAVV